MKIKIEVISQTGYCKNGCKVGDVAFVSETSVQGKICIHSLYSMLPKAFAMLYNAKFDWTEGDITHACPDYKNPVVYKLEVNK